MRKVVIALAVLGAMAIGAVSAQADRSESEPPEGSSRRADFNKCSGTVTTSQGTARNIRVYNLSCKKGKRIIRNPLGGNGVGHVMCLMGEPKHGGYLYSCISETGTVRFLFKYRDGRVGPARRAGDQPCVDRYDNDQCRVKPSHWGLGAHPVMRSINWNNWGGRKAVGKGRIVYVGEGVSEPGVIKLRRLQDCGRRTEYTKVSVTFKETPAYSYDFRTGC